MSSEDDAITNGGGPTPQFKTIPIIASHRPSAPALPDDRFSRPLTGTATDSMSSTTSSQTSSSRPTSAFWQTSMSAESQQSSEPHGSNALADTARPNPPSSRWTKARSTSTESSLSLSGMTTLGSVYNQDGFPNYPQHDDEKDIAQLQADDAAIAKQLALTDEAVRQINGTASVIQARGLGMPTTTSSHTYELPRSMAAFVHRQPIGDDTGIPAGRSFVSSGSSTSSEESEHLASVQWVKSVSGPSASYNTVKPYLASFAKKEERRQESSPKMPPPQSINAGRRVTSPRRNGGGLPSTNGTPVGNYSSLSTSVTHTSNSHPAPPGLPTGGYSGDGTPNHDNDDDDQTVGGFREGSPSSSSASGLDLLSHAAAHHERSRYSTYVKRKAGQEAVAQWRESGIPSGTPRLSDVRAGSGGYDSPGYDSTPSDHGPRPADRTSEPPKKRRKSEMQLETPESGLQQPPSDYEEEAESGDNSSYEDAASGGDSEYGNKRRANQRSGKAKKNPTARVRAMPVPAAPPSAGSSAKGASSAPKKSRKSSPTPGGSRTAARRPSEGEASATGKPGVGVQCEYVNPLPPYQRCPDIFTRKYDIPRHMARHARREGELVAEGKLPEEKALLWKTIRDKPKIRCKTCGEFFTRQDALKRHQTKQHHH